MEDTLNSAANNEDTNSGTEGTSVFNTDPLKEITERLEDVIIVTNPARDHNSIEDKLVQSSEDIDINGDICQDEDQKSIECYSNKQNILLVRDGDFSSTKYVLIHYSNARENLELLEELGCTAVHGMNADDMPKHPTLRLKQFDKILFNFPHVGCDQQFNKLYKNLTKRFLITSARHMLTDAGEVHVTHKVSERYCGMVSELINNNKVKEKSVEVDSFEDAISIVANPRDIGNGDTCEDQEKWIKHYSNKHKILLVGEGDFSFALCLAKAFGSASNMVATSLDSRGD